MPAGEREAADDTHAARREDSSLGQRHALTVALEAACDADPLGMVAPEARMDTVHLLKPVDKPCLAEASWREPSGDVSKADRNG